MNTGPCRKEAKTVCQGNRTSCIMRRLLRHSYSFTAVGLCVCIIFNIDAYLKVFLIILCIQGGCVDLFHLVRQSYLVTLFRIQILCFVCTVGYLLLLNFNNNIWFARFFTANFLIHSLGFVN